MKGKKNRCNEWIKESIDAFSSIDSFKQIAMKEGLNGLIGRFEVNFKYFVSIMRLLNMIRLHFSVPKQDC